MNEAWKKSAALAIAVACSAIIAGCGSLSYDAPAISMQSAADNAGPQVTRARVVAELREAQRLGLITVGEEDVPQPTAEQNRMIAEAGNRAAEEAAKLAKSH
jgi:hypothetical protein